MARYYPGILIVILVLVIIDLMVDLGWLNVG